MSKIRIVLIQLVGWSIIALGLWGVYRLGRAAWSAFSSLNPGIAASLVAGAATVLGATLTVMAGRYLERKRELEALYRDKKLPIYSKFLEELFKRFQHVAEEGEEDDALVQFLHEWHIQIALWGGPKVVNAYLEWKAALQGGANAKAIFATDKLILAIRKEMGNVNRGMPRGLFAHLILRNPNLLLSMAAANPDVSLEELSREERRLGLTDDASAS